MENKSIHETQKHKWLDENTFEVRIKVYLNYELERLILSYGDSVKVISPIKLQDIIKMNSKDDTSYEILKILIDNIDEKKSIFQLFNQLKSKIKISKDRFYEECKELEDKNSIFFVGKYNQEKSLKKIYSYNYAFLGAISFSKKFKQEFANMIFLELLKEKKTIYYLDNIDFYIKEDNLAIVCIPFFNIDLNSNLLKKIIKNALELNIEKIEIITISNNQKIDNKKINIEAIVFYEWALI